MRINQILKKGIVDLKSVGIPHPRLEAETLLLRAIVKTRLIASPPTMEWLIANPDFPINSETMKQFDSFLVRRSKFEPVAYITYHKEFYGYDFYVNNHVLIPRPESEILVEKAIETIKKLEERRKKKAQDWNVECRMSNVDEISHSIFNILELGTGSGCIIISIIKELQKQKVNLSNFKFTATDISKDAIGVARKNARQHNVDQLVHLVQSDLFDYFSSQMSNVRCQMFDIIIANLPYVPSYWLSQSDWAKTLYFEPDVALNGGLDGLDVYLRFFLKAPKYLAPNGTILIECEDDQVQKILKIARHGLLSVSTNFSCEILIFRDYRNLQRAIQITATPGVD